MLPSVTGFAKLKNSEVMKKYIEKLFPSALNAIETVLQTKDGVPMPIEKEYQSYISSFGASIMQMGLLPTLAVYADEDSGSKADRRKIIEVLANVIASTDSTFSQKNLITDKKKLFDFAAKNLNAAQRIELKEQLLDAAIAVKLCLRTFKLSAK